MIVSPPCRSRLAAAGESNTWTLKLPDALSSARGLVVGVADVCMVDAAEVDGTLPGSPLQPAIASMIAAAQASLRMHFCAMLRACGSAV